MPQPTQHRPQPATDDAGAPPVEKFRDGPVHVSIWEKQSVKGSFRTASFELRYKDKEDQWQSGKSYGSNALLHLESAAREARARIESWQQSSNVKHAPHR